MSDYCQAAQAVGGSLYTIALHPPFGLLTPLRIGSQIKGFFKPLTKSIDAKTPIMTMVGCDVSVQGVGVQWTLDKVGEADDSANTCVELTSSPR